MHSQRNESREFDGYRKSYESNKKNDDGGYVRGADYYGGKYND